MLALFFACQMSRGAEQLQVWSANTVLVEDVITSQPSVNMFRP